jgi:endonuclease/exonuclease/phosphatase family metal-dependent hydrolase
VVASYNIHGCVGTDRRHDTTRVAKVIRELGADVLGLQELHAHGIDPDPTDEIQFLAAVSGFEVVTGTTFVGPRGAYGIALFSRYPILAARRIDLSVPPREPRCALDVDVTIEHRTIRVITTHLGLAPWERRLQVRRLTEAIGRDPSRLTIVLGDINEWFHLARTLRQLGAHFGRSSMVRTWPSWQPLFALDRIWVHPPEALISVWAHISPVARHASDHLPLVGIIETVWPDAPRPMADVSSLPPEGRLS